MVDHPALYRACAEYARTIMCPYEVGDVLYRLTDQILEVLDVSGSAVSLGEGGRLRFVAASDQHVATLEESQLEVGEGPCHEAWSTGKAVAVSDLAAGGRWPRYTPIALAAGQRAVVGVPLTASAGCIGAVNIYRTTPHDWAAEDLEAAQLLADLAAGYVVNQRTLEHSRALATQLQQALASRIIIEQAKGVLAERHGIDVGAAFERLRQHARHHNRNLHALARDVVEGRSDL